MAKQLHMALPALELHSVLNLIFKIQEALYMAGGGVVATYIDKTR